MAAPDPTRRSFATTLKEKLLKPALTSHYECHFNPPGEVIEWLEANALIYRQKQELITLSCSEASLPGSSLNTIDLMDDHHGVNEKHAYRRQFDNTANFTFYVDAPKKSDNGDVDRGYNTLWFFEKWISFIMDERGQREGTDIDNINWFFRTKFPKQYQTTIYLNKFERDHDLKYIDVRKDVPWYLAYKFVQAYPIAINSMPVSYEQSQLLKCTVTFNYSRYVVRRKRGKSEGDSLPYISGTEESRRRILGLDNL